jgi:hypothetical protein
MASDAATRIAGMSTSELRQALDAATRQAKRAAARHDVPAAHALRDALEAAALRAEAPDREWISTAIRETAAWATDDADVPLLAALGALARAARG